MSCGSPYRDSVQFDGRWVDSVATQLTPKKVEKE